MNTSRKLSSPASASLFSQVTESAPDPILGLNAEFAADKNPKKQNLGPGIYMDEKGLTRPLLSVLEAEKRFLSSERREGYLPIEGLPAFRSGIQGLVLGEELSKSLGERVTTVQSLGGTGSLCLGGYFIRRTLPHRTVCVSNPTWQNHIGIFSEMGFKVTEYPYFDSATFGVKFEEMLKGLQALPENSVVVLHACCHNPTGADLSDEQWRKLADFFEQSTHLAFIDLAYQGFKNGLKEDSYPIRLFAERGLSFLAAVSGSKGFSLYSQRVGALMVFSENADQSGKILSQLKSCVRTIYSNPPSFGAQLVSRVLSDADLRPQWETELSQMRIRIRQMREKLVAGLKERGVSMPHVLSQYGMFSYTGLNPTQVKTLKEKFGLYIVGSGRISVPALNEGNIDYVADAIASVSSPS